MWERSPAPGKPGLEPLPAPSHPHLPCLCAALQPLPPYNSGIIMNPGQKDAERFREKRGAGTRSTQQLCFYDLLEHSTPNPRLWSPVFAHNISGVSRGPSPQEWPQGLLLPTAPPPSMAAAAWGRLGTSGGKVKATLPLGIIEDDNGILCLMETGRDQRQHRGAAATGRNSLANATNYPKLAAVMAITIKGLPGFHQTDAEVHF